MRSWQTEDCGTSTQHVWSFCACVAWFKASVITPACSTCWLHKGSTSPTVPSFTHKQLARAPWLQELNGRSTWSCARCIPVIVGGGRTKHQWWHLVSRVPALAWPPAFPTAVQMWVSNTSWLWGPAIFGRRTSGEYHKLRIAECVSWEFVRPFKSNEMFNPSSNIHYIGNLQVQHYSMLCVLKQLSRESVDCTRGSLCWRDSSRVARRGFQPLWNGGLTATAAEPIWLSTMIVSGPGAYAAHWGAMTTYRRLPALSPSPSPRSRLSHWIGLFVPPNHVAVIPFFSIWPTSGIRYVLSDFNPFCLWIIMFSIC